MKHIPYILLLSVILLCGCTGNYTIIGKSNNDAWGTVTGGGEYGKGDVAILTAIPASGYFFLGWKDGDNTNPRIITVKGNKTFTALFSDSPFGDFDGNPIHLNGKISNDQVWPDLGLDVDYIVDGTLIIGGNATVRVMPNVTIMFSGSDGNIEIVEHGALNMMGTEQGTVVLRGPENQSTSGSWGRVVVNSSRIDNVFQWVEFLNGGNHDNLHGGVVNVRGTLSMMCCTIDGSNGSGLVTEEGCALTTFAYNTIKNCAGYPWVTSNFPDLCRSNIVGNYLFPNNSLNNRPFVYIDLDHYEINESLVLPSLLNTWYYFPHGFYFDGNGSLTLDESFILVGGGKQLRVGKNLNFRAIGDFLYVSIFPFSKIPWKGIVFESERDDNVMQVCWLTCGRNSNGYCLKVAENAKLTMSNCRLGPSRKYGVWIENIQTWNNVTHSGISNVQCPKFAHIEHGGTFNGQTYADNTDLDQLP